MPAKVKSDFKAEEILLAVIIADTFDNKLHPLTLDTPKILIPFLNVPLIEHTLEALTSSGIQETFIFCCNHSNQVSSYLDNSKWNDGKSKMKVRLIISHNCHSMGDALRDINKKDIIRSDFVLLYGDTLFSISLLSAIKIHKDRKQQENNIALTMIIKKVGVDELLEDDKLWLLEELKQRILDSRNIDNIGNTSTESTDMNAERYSILNCQICVCSPIVLPLMEDNFDYHSIDDLVKGISSSEVLGYTFYYHMIKKKEYASRIWGFQSYEAIALNVFDKWTNPLVTRRNNMNLDGNSYSLYDKNIYLLHASLNSCEENTFGENVAIGRNTVIGKNAVISNSVIGRNCKIGNDVTMENCFVFDDVIIEDGCKLTKCFVSNFSHIEKNVVVPMGCVIGNHVKVFSSDSLSFNTRLVSMSMSDSLEALSSKKGGYVFFTHNVSALEDKKLWDWGEIVEESGEPDFAESDEPDFGESDSDSDDEEYENSISCYKELLKTLKRYISHNISMENLKLDINSVKNAFRIYIKELHIFLIRAILALPNNFPAYAPEVTNYIPRFKMMITHFFPLLQHCKTQSKEAERNILIAMEEACKTDCGTLNSIAVIAKLLYDEDILSEEEILAWWKDDKIEHMPAVERRMTPFIMWLETADEEESDEESDEEFDEESSEVSDDCNSI